MVDEINCVIYSSHMPTLRRTAEFADWLRALRDRQARAIILRRIDRLAEGNPGSSRGLSGGVSEMKIDFGPGYRVYFTQRGSEVILLLIGGDKNTQQRNIERAIELAKEG